MFPTLALQTARKSSSHKNTDGSLWNNLTNGSILSASSVCDKPANMDFLDIESNAPTRQNCRFGVRICQCLEHVRGAFASCALAGIWSIVSTSSARPICATQHTPPSGFRIAVTPPYEGFGGHSERLWLTLANPFLTSPFGQPILAKIRG